MSLVVENFRSVEIRSTIGGREFSFSIFGGGFLDVMLKAVCGLCNFASRAFCTFGGPTVRDEESVFANCCEFGDFFLFPPIDVLGAVLSIFGARFILIVFSFFDFKFPSFE